MILDGDVFCAWAHAWALGNLDAGLIVLENGAIYFGGDVIEGKDVLQFVQELCHWYRRSHGVREGNVFSFCGGQGNFSLQL